MSDTRLVRFGLQDEATRLQVEAVRLREAADRLDAEAEKLIDVVHLLKLKDERS